MKPSVTWSLWGAITATLSVSRGSHKVQAQLAAHGRQATGRVLCQAGWSVTSSRNKPC